MFSFGELISQIATNVSQEINSSGETNETRSSQNVYVWYASKWKNSLIPCTSLPRSAVVTDRILHTGSTVPLTHAVYRVFIYDFKFRRQNSVSEIQVWIIQRERFMGLCGGGSTLRLSQAVWLGRFPWILWIIMLSTESVNIACSEQCTAEHSVWVASPYNSRNAIVALVP